MTRAVRKKLIEVCILCQAPVIDWIKLLACRVLDHFGSSDEPRAVKLDVAESGTAAVKSPERKPAFAPPSAAE